MGSHVSSIWVEWGFHEQAENVLGFWEMFLLRYQVFDVGGCVGVWSWRDRLLGFGRGGVDGSDGEE